MVQPLIARYELELQVAQLFKRAIIRTKATCSRLPGPAEMTLVTSSCHGMPRKSRKVGRMRGGKSRSVSGLYMSEKLFRLDGCHTCGLLGCAGGIFPRCIIRSDALVILGGFGETGFIVNIAPEGCQFIIMVHFDGVKGAEFCA